MRKLLILLPILADVMAAQYLPQAFTRPGGATPPAFVQSCSGAAFGVTSQACVFSSNVTAGNYIIIFADVLNAGTLSVAGCGITWTSGTLEDSGTQVLWAYGAAVSTGGCTITATAGTSGTMSIVAAEYNHTSGIDAANGLNGVGFVPAATPFNCPTVTTVSANATVICGIVDGSANSDVYTPGAGYTMRINFSSYGSGIEDTVQASPGTVTPTASYASPSRFVSGTIALKP